MPPSPLAYSMQLITSAHHGPALLTSFLCKMLHLIDCCVETCSIKSNVKPYKLYIHLILNVYWYQSSSNYVSDILFMRSYFKLWFTTGAPEYWGRPPLIHWMNVGNTNHFTSNTAMYCGQWCAHFIWFLCCSWPAKLVGANVIGYPGPELKDFTPHFDFILAASLLCGFLTRGWSNN